MLKFNKLRPPLNLSGGAFQVVVNPVEQGDYVLISAVSFALTTDATVIDRSVLYAQASSSEFVQGPLYVRKTWVPHQASRTVTYTFVLGQTPRAFNPGFVGFAATDDYWADDLPEVLLQNAATISVQTLNLQAGDALSRLEVQYWSGKPNEFGPIL